MSAQQRRWGQRPWAKRRDNVENIEVKDIADLARRAVGTEVNSIKRPRTDDVPFIVVGEDREVQSAADLVNEFEKTQGRPYRRRGTYHAADIASLLDWMKQHCSEESPVFGEGLEKLVGEWKKPKLALVGIGNYSRGEDTPAWHDFQVRYDFPVTLAWAKWAEKHGEWLGQEAFAEFIESRIYEISTPLRGETLSEPVTRFLDAMGGEKIAATPTKLFELSRGLKIMVSEKVEVQLDRNSGEEKLQFSEEHTGAGGRPINIPKMFYIRIPVFFGQEPSLVGAVLRYRNAGGGKVVWSYELFAPDMIVSEQFEKACDRVRKAERTLFLGTADRI